MPHHHNNRGRDFHEDPLIREFLEFLKEEKKDLKEKVKENENKKKCFHEWELKKLVPFGGVAERIAKNLSGQVNITQLRKLFNEVKHVCTLGKKGNIKIAYTKLLRLYPKIAYATARDLLPEEFGDVLIKVLKKVEKCNQPEDYERLDDFFTALIAYAKYYESLKNRNRRFKK